VPRENVIIMEIKIKNRRNHSFLMFSLKFVIVLIKVKVRKIFRKEYIMPNKSFNFSIIHGKGA